MVALLPKDKRVEGKDETKMKTLDKFILGLFSCIILIGGFIICLALFGWLNLDFIGWFYHQVQANNWVSNSILLITVLCMLFAIKGLFFTSENRPEHGQEGVLLENEDGKLLISTQTLQNLVEGVAKQFDNAENIQVDVVLDPSNKVIVFLSMNVKENVIIKELSNNLQTKIKNAIKKTSDLEVEAVNIKIRNIEYTQEEK